VGVFSDCKENMQTDVPFISFIPMTADALITHVHRLYRGGGGVRVWAG
jgi:hypothetical protein